MIRDNIARAQERVAEALAEYESAKAELAWWIEGLRLLDPDSAQMVERTGDARAVAEELFPDGVVFETGSKPTLRQAIVLVMRMHPSMTWTIKDLATALAGNDWLPEREDATKRISDLAGQMVQGRQLIRVERGRYKLAPALLIGVDQAELGRLRTGDRDPETGMTVIVRDEPW